MQPGNGKTEPVFRCGGAAAGLPASNIAEGQCLFGMGSVHFFSVFFCLPLAWK